MLESPTAKIGMLLVWSSFEGSFDLAAVAVPPRVICRKQTVIGCRNWPLSVPFIPIMCKGSPVFKEYIRILLLPRIKKSFSCHYDVKLKSSRSNTLLFRLRKISILVITGIGNSKLTPFWIYCNIFWFLKFAENIRSPTFFFERIKKSLEQHNNTISAINVWYLSKSF